MRGALGTTSWPREAKKSRKALRIWADVWLWSSMLMGTGDLARLAEGRRRVQGGLSRPAVRWLDETFELDCMRRSFALALARARGVRSGCRALGSRRRGRRRGVGELERVR